MDISQTSGFLVWVLVSIRENDLIEILPKFGFSKTANSETKNMLYLWRMKATIYLLESKSFVPKIYETLYGHMGKGRTK